MTPGHGHKTAIGDIHLDIRLTHQEMANMIGTTRQSVTSALNMLKRLGVLDFDDSHHIRIHSERLMNRTRSEQERMQHSPQKHLFDRPTVACSVPRLYSRVFVVNTL